MKTEACGSTVKKAHWMDLKEYAAGLIAPAQTRVMLAVDEQVLLQAAVDVMDLFNQFDVRNISVSATQRFAQ